MNANALACSIDWDDIEERFKSLTTLWLPLETFGTQDRKEAISEAKLIGSKEEVRVPIRVEYGAIILPTPEIERFWEQVSWEFMLSPVCPYPHFLAPDEPLIRRLGKAIEARQYYQGFITDWATFNQWLGYFACLTELQKPIEAELRKGLRGARGQSTLQHEILYALSCQMIATGLKKHQRSGANRRLAYIYKQISDGKLTKSTGEEYSQEEKDWFGRFLAVTDEDCQPRVAPRYTEMSENKIKSLLSEYPNGFPMMPFVDPLTYRKAAANPKG